MASAVFPRNVIARTTLPWRIMAVLFLVAALPFWRQLLFGAGVIDGDVYVQNLPAWEWFGRTLHSGESLLWAPEILGGFPMAFTQWPLFYPPDLLLAWVLPPFYAYSWSIVLHIFLAGALTYGYGRAIGLRPAAALLVAISFELSSEVVAGGSGFAARSSYVLPGMLLAVELVVRRGWRYGPLLSLIVAAGLLGGHFQPVLIHMSVGAIYALFLVTRIWAKAGPREAVTVSWRLALPAALGMAGGAVRLLPTWEVMTLSTRAGGLPMDPSNPGAMALPGLLVGYLMPLTRMGNLLPWGAPGYAGPAVLLLALLSLRRLAADSRGRFFLGLGAASAALSMGESTPLFWLTQLPLFSFFREPSRFSILTTFSLALLGGMALDRFEFGARGKLWWNVHRYTLAAVLACLFTAALFTVGLFYQVGVGPLADGLRQWIQGHHLEALHPMRLRVALAVLGLPASALVLALAARGRLSPFQSRTLLVLLTMAVLMPIAAILNPPIDAAVLGKVPETVRFLESQSGTYRIYSDRPGIALYNHLSYWGPSPEVAYLEDLVYRFEAEMIAPVTSLRWGIDAIDGYENLHSRYQDEIMRALAGNSLPEADPTGKSYSLSMEQRVRLLRLLNVRYLLSGVDLSTTTPDLRLASRFQVDFGPSSGAPAAVFLLENPNPLPRYYVVSQARLFDLDADALYALASGEIDARTTVALASADPEVAGGSALPSASSDGGTSSVEPVSQHNAEVVLRVSNDHPGYLVTSDSYWPGWRAFVDGQEAPVLRANVGGRAVWLAETGTHLVTFRFEPREFTVGLLLSIGAALVVLAWAIPAVVKSR